VKFSYSIIQKLKNSEKEEPNLRGGMRLGFEGGYLVVPQNVVSRSH